MQNLQRRIHRNVGCSIVSPLFFPNSSNGVSSSSTTELSQAHSNPSQAHSKLASAPSRFIYRPPRPQTTPTKRRVGTYLNSRAEAVCLGVNWSDFEGVTNPCRQLFYSQNHPNSTPISGPPHSTPKQHKTHKKNHTPRISQSIRHRTYPLHTRIIRLIHRQQIRTRRRAPALREAARI